MLIYYQRVLFAFIFLYASTVVAADIAPNVVIPERIRPSQSLNTIDIAPAATPESRSSTISEPLSITLSKVIVSIPYASLTQATQNFTQQIEGKRVSVAYIYEAAAQLEQAYAQAGYILVRVVVPPQSLQENGQLQVNVIQGFIEAIDVSTLPAATQKVVLARTNQLIHNPDITLNQIERALMIAGDIPGVHLKSTLVRGEQEGGAKLVLNCDCQPFSVSLGLDNRLDHSLERWQAASVFAVNSLTGWQAYGILGTGGDWSHFFDSQSTLNLHGFGFVMPLGDDGLTLNPEYTASLVKPHVGAGNLRTRGEFERYALRLQYPWLRSRSQMLDVKLGLEHISQNTAATDFNTDLNKDRYDVTRLGADYQQRFNNLGLQLSMQLSQGLDGRDVDRNDTTATPLSRQSASTDFTKMNAALRLSYLFDNKLQTSLIVLGQTAFNHAQLRAEQFGLDGKDAVSVFPSGTLVADTGATVRAELSRNFSMALKQQFVVLAPYLFVADGWGKLVAPTIVENDNLHANAWGIGLRTYLTKQNSVPISLNFEIGKGESNQPNYENFWRSNFSLLINY